MLEYKKEELRTDGKWFKSISTGDTKAFRKHLTERIENGVTYLRKRKRHLGYSKVNLY